jgi:hypothetical protein
MRSCCLESSASRLEIHIHAAAGNKIIEHVNTNIYIKNHFMSLDVVFVMRTNAVVGHLKEAVDLGRISNFWKSLSRAGLALKPTTSSCRDRV